MVGDFDSELRRCLWNSEANLVGLLAGAAKAPDVRRPDAKPEGWRSAKVSSAGAPAAQPMRNHFCSESNTPPPRGSFCRGIAFSDQCRDFGVLIFEVLSREGELLWNSRSKSGRIARWSGKGS
jgi:hypothetical protein